MKLKKTLFNLLTSSILIVGTITPTIVMTSCATNSESHKNIKIVNPNSSSLINDIEIELGNNFNIEVTIDQGEFTNEQLELIYQNLQWEVQLLDSNNQLENYKLYVNKTDTNGVWKITNTDENNINTGISEGHHRIEITATANVNDVVYQGTSQIDLTVNYTAPSEQQFQYEYVAAGVDQDLPQEHYAVSGINEANIKGTTLFIPDHYNDGTHGELPVLNVGDIFSKTGPGQDLRFLNKITSLYISDGIQKISFILSENLSNLNSLKLPNHMKKISLDQSNIDGGFTIGYIFYFVSSSLSNIEFAGNEYYGFLPGANEGSGIVYEGSELASDLSNVVLAVGDVIVPDDVDEINLFYENGIINFLGFSFQPITSVSLPSINKIIDNEGNTINMNNYTNYIDYNDEASKLSTFFACCFQLQKIILRDHGQNGLLEYQYGNGYDSGILMLKGQQLNENCTNFIAICGNEFTLPENVISIINNYSDFSHIYCKKLIINQNLNKFCLNSIYNSVLIKNENESVIYNVSIYLNSSSVVNIVLDGFDYGHILFDIYVPSNLLNQYQTKYLNIANYFKAI